MKNIYANGVRNIVLSVIIFGILTGCGNKTDYIKGTSIEIKKLAPVTLTFYMPGDEKIDTKEVHDKVSAATNLNIELNFIWSGYSSYDKLIKTAIASNKKIDAFLYFYGPEIIKMSRKGEIKNITTLLPKYAPTIYAQISSQQLKAAMVDGKLIAVPSLFPQANYVSVNVRPDLVKKYNISSINTIEDYGMLLKRFKDDGYSSPAIIYYRIDKFANAYGYAVLDYAQNLVYKWDDPKMKIIPWEQTLEFKETVNFTSNWYKNGYLKPYENVIGEDICSFLALSTSSAEGLIKDAGRNYNRYILYKDRKIQRFSPIMTPNGYGGYNAIVFNSNSKNIERSLLFLNWIQSSQKNYDLFMYGIKGKNYILKDDRISLLKGMKSYSSDSTYNWALDTFKNINLDRLFDTILYYPDSYQRKDRIEFVNTKTQYAPHEGFFPDYKNVQSYYVSRGYIYQSKIEQALSNSTYDINETEKIINEIKDAGTDTIVKEIQKQLDKWRTGQ